MILNLKLSQQIMTSNVSYLDPLQVSVFQYPSLTWVQEGSNQQICFKINRVVTESVHIHVKTTHTTGDVHVALGKTHV